MSRKKINDTSNVKSVSEIIEEKKEVTVDYKDQVDTLVIENTNLCLIINQLQTRSKEYEAKIKHLEDMLSKSVPLIGGGISRIVKPDEKQIAELQLDKLKQKAMTTELTLEEARKFEIFSKVKMNLEQKSENTISASYQNLPSDDAKLLAIASSNIKKIDIKDE